MTKTKKKSCCINVLRVLFMHFGLIVIVVAYALLGAYIFGTIETHNEKLKCIEAKGNESITVTTLISELRTSIPYNISASNNQSLQTVHDWLTDFRDNVFALEHEYGYNGQDCNETSNWNFPTALLFAVTAITSIGYGTPATPKTWEGQIVCICYASIGIPIFLLCIANTSGVLGGMTRYIYSRILCRCYYASKKKRSTSTTIDYMNNTAIESVVNKNLKEFDSNHPYLYDNNLADVETNPNNEIIKKNLDTVVIQNELNVSLKDDDERVQVPLTVSMLIMTAYLALGAITFNYFEQWGLVTSTYFSFVTVATIGFGDFVPGSSPTDKLAVYELIITVVYIIFGISVLGMCFDLMQEEMIAKITWISEKLGLHDENAHHYHHYNNYDDDFSKIK